MTSLAKQLQRLAIPHTQAILGEDKKKASLLFDPKEAASIDKETFHALGLNGLEELETIDGKFEEFESSLFGDSSLTFERSVQTKEVNNTLDVTINGFLVRLSPYCLLKPAHKALEWLVYRFHIHMYNIDELLMCFMPYHESKIFVRVLQLIKFDSKFASKWDWLEPLQKSGVHLSRLTLINHCKTNPAFLSFVCDMVPNAVKVLTVKDGCELKCRVVFSFYATCVVGVLEAGGLKEELIATLLPHLSRGMKSRVVEYKAASYMILAQLLHKATLEPKIVEKLQNILAKSIVASVLDEAMACMLLMFQTQSVDKITTKSFKHMCSHYSIVDSIAKLSTQFNADLFISCFLERLVPKAFKNAVGIATSGESSESESSGGMREYLSMLHRFLSNIKLQEDTAEKAAYNFLTVYVSHGNNHLDEDIDGRIKDSLQGIVRQLEGKHSAAVDRAVKRLMKKHGDNKHKQGLIQEFLNLYVLSVPRQLITDSETSLVLSLNHRLASVRERAVTTLLGNRQGIEDETFLKESVVMRLKDEDPKVVMATLNLGQDIWTVVDDDQLTISLLQKHVQYGLGSKSWQETASMATIQLGSYSGDLDLEIVTSYLPCFFIKNASTMKFNMSLVTTLLTSPLAKTNSLLKTITAEWSKKKGSLVSNISSLGEVNICLARCVTLAVIQDMDNNLHILSGWCRLALECGDLRLLCLMMIVLDDLVTMVTNMTTKLQLCHLQLVLVERVQRRKKLDIVCKQDQLTQEWKDLIGQKVEKLQDNRIPVIFCLKALHNIIQAIHVPECFTKDVKLWQLRGDNGMEDVFLCVCVRLYNILLDNAMSDGPIVSLYRSLVKIAEKSCFSESSTYLKLLGLLWTQHSNDLVDDLQLTLTLQVRSLQLGVAYVRNADTQTMEYMLKSASVLSNILMVLTSEHEPIREVGLQIARELFLKAEEHHSVYTSLLKKVVRCEGEIRSDAAYICQVIASVFKSTSVVGTAVPELRLPRKSGRKSVGKSADHVDGNGVCLGQIVGVIVDPATPLFVQYSLLQILSALNNKEVLTSLYPFIDRLLIKGQNATSKMAANSLNLLVKKFTVETKDCLGVRSEGLRLYQQLLTSEQKIEADNITTQMIAIEQVTKALFTSLESESQHKLLATLFDVCVTTQELNVANQIRKTLKHLSVDASHIQEELKCCLKQSTATTVREAKRQKRTSMATEETMDTVFDSKAWQRTTIILEAVQSKKKIYNYQLLIPVCFQILSSVLESENHISAEYIKQLILTLLYNLCGRMDTLTEEESNKIVPVEQFNMDLIVNCIRSSDNPQTHHQALLLLTTAAKIYPEHLLHNMMSVFTFMGANIMRQDDAYSFLIISKILETVIPALITACEQRQQVPAGITNDLEDIITMVIQVFVDSYTYIPGHRRHLLFNKLLSVIGEGQYLWRTLLLMMDLVVTKGTLKAEITPDTQTTGASSSSDIEFCLSLSSDFTSAVKLSSAREMIKYLLKLPDDKEDDMVKRTKPAPKSFGKLQKDDVSIFNVGLHSAKQLRHFKFATVHLLLNLFSSTDFVAQMAATEDSDILSQFQQLLETLLQFVSHVTMVTNRYSDKPTVKFWKALQHKSHDLLDKLVSLLPDSMFIDVIGGLVSHDLTTIQRKALDLLNLKLQQQKVFTDTEISALLPLVEQLRALVSNLSLEGEQTEEGNINCQTAFISLKLVCRNIGHKHTTLFIQVLKTAIEVLRHDVTTPQVSSCALLCIAEICNTLKVHVIQHLPTFMPVLLHIMADQDTLIQNELYLMSVVTTVNKVVENLSYFLSPYLLDILQNVCLLSSKCTEEDVLQKPQVQLRLKTIRTSLSTTLPTRVLLPAVTTCYTRLITADVSSISSLMSLFGDHISHIGREDLISHMSQLQTFFLQCLDLRIDYPQLKEKTISAIETVTIETIITMVMKLSEATFKPFLFKVYDWATSTDEYRDRVLVFYKLAERLAERLRSLFTLFASHIVNHAAKMLEMNNKMKKGPKFFPTDKSKRKKSCLLLEHILDCIYKCCLYDTEGFITKERFDLLMPPLVDQIENEQGGEERYLSRVSDHLVPCLVQLAMAAQDDSLWRNLNYQICLKTRSAQPKVKEGALQTLEQLHDKLKEDYMPLLPDTIPFIAELMEDDSEEVEKKCQEVIRKMEATLGEPLQKYF